MTTAMLGTVDPRAARCVAMYRTGIKVGDIRECLRCDSHAIYRWLREAGAPKRGKGRGPNAVTWTQTLWGGRFADDSFRDPATGWDLDRLIEISEGRNAAIVANGCSSFPRVEIAA